MKTLYLIRHAKSSWDDQSLDDFDRPLNNRGKKSACKMGRRLHRAGEQPLLFLSSPAKRARATAKCMAKELCYPKKDIVFCSELYESDLDDVLGLVLAQLKMHKSIALVGHNPDFSDLTGMLCGRDIYMVTAAVIAIDYKRLHSWADLFRGRLRFHDYPKNDQSPLCKKS